MWQIRNIIYFYFIFIISKTWDLNIYIYIYATCAYTTLYKYMVYHDMKIKQYKTMDNQRYNENNEIFSIWYLLIVMLIYFRLFFFFLISKVFLCFTFAFNGSKTIVLLIGIEIFQISRRNSFSTDLSAIYFECQSLLYIYKNN